MDSYYHSDTSLYLVHEKHGDHALVEDCLNGLLIDMDVDTVLRLTPVRVDDAGRSETPPRVLSDQPVGNTG